MNSHSGGGNYPSSSAASQPLTAPTARSLPSRHLILSRNPSGIEMSDYRMRLPLSRIGGTARQSLVEKLSDHANDLYSEYDTSNEGRPRLIPYDLRIALRLAISNYSEQLLHAVSRINTAFPTETMVWLGPDPTPIPRDAYSEWELVDEIRLLTDQLLDEYDSVRSLTRPGLWDISYPWREFRSIAQQVHGLATALDIEMRQPTYARTSQRNRGRIWRQR